MLTGLINPEIHGAVCALGSAFFWAFGTVLVKKLDQKLSAFGLNFGKSLLLVLYFLIAVACYRPEMPDFKVGWILMLSGFIGITVGDTLYFMTLSRLGPRELLLLTTMIPAVTACASVSLLGEHLSAIKWCGIALILAGILIAFWKSNDNNSGKKSGVVLGLVTVLSYSSSILLSKIALRSTSAITAGLYRQATGLITLLVFGLMSRKLLKWVKPFSDRGVLKLFTAATFFGAFLGMWLNLLALKLTDASIATALNSMTPLFAIPVSYFVLKDRITMRAVAGAAVSVTGVILLLCS